MRDTLLNKSLKIDCGIHKFTILISMMEKKLIGHLGMNRTLELFILIAMGYLLQVNLLII